MIKRKKQQSCFFVDYKFNLYHISQRETIINLNPLFSNFLQFIVKTYLTQVKLGIWPICSYLSHPSTFLDPCVSLILSNFMVDKSIVA